VKEELKTMPLFLSRSQYTTLSIQNQYLQETLTHKKIYYPDGKGIKKAKEVVSAIKKLISSQYEQLEKIFEWRFYTYLFKKGEEKWELRFKPESITLFEKKQKAIPKEE